jgi:hypothetical protein
MKHLKKLACIFPLSILSCFGTTLTFEDLTPGTSLTTYQGFQWSGFYAINGATAINNGYYNAVVSPYKVIGDIDGRSATISNGPAFFSFSLNSAYLTAELNDGLQVEVQGFIGSTLAYDNTYTVNTTGPTLINFNYFGVNRVTFIPSGGTLHPGYSDAGVHDHNFAMDNLTLNVPEPRATVLLIVSLVTWVMFFSRKDVRLQFASSSARARCKKSLDTPAVPSTSK